MLKRRLVLVGIFAAAAAAILSFAAAGTSAASGFSAHSRS